MFITRLLSGIVLLILTGLFVTLGGVPLMLVLALISSVGFLELTKAVGIERESNGINLLEVIGILGTVFIYAVQVIAILRKEAVDVVYIIGVVVFTIIALLAAYVVKFPTYHATQIVEVIFALMYVPVMLGFIGMTRALPNIGHKAVWLIWISAWGSDTFAYVVGMLTARTCGNHKAFPVLSPKKSYEGCIGGIIGAAGLGLLFGKYIMGAEYDFVLIGIICGIGSIIAQCGDLAASAIKRNFEIKDYGHCIPGHGGILDRFDSIIFTAPCIYFLVYFFLDIQYVLTY